MAAPYLDHVGTDKYANQCDKPTTIQDWEQRTIVSKMRHTTEALHKVAYNNKLYGNKDLSLSKYGQKLIDEADASRHAKQYSMTIQSYGISQATPCSFCAHNTSGPFEDCRTMLKERDGFCANCLWYERKWCSKSHIQELKASNSAKEYRKRKIVPKNLPGDNENAEVSSKIAKKSSKVEPIVLINSDNLRDQAKHIRKLAKKVEKYSKALSKAVAESYADEPVVTSNPTSD